MKNRVGSKKKIMTNINKKGGENMSERKPGQKLVTSRARTKREQAVIDAAIACVRTAMRRSDKNEAAVAKALNVSPPNVYQALDSGRAMTLRTMARLVDACGFEVSFSLKAAA